MCNRNKYTLFTQSHHIVGLTLFLLSSYHAKFTSNDDNFLLRGSYRHSACTFLRIIHCRSTFSCLVRGKLTSYNMGKLYAFHPLMTRLLHNLTSSDVSPRVSSLIREKNKLKSVLIASIISTDQSSSSTAIN